jgi:uncharacterized protein
MAQKSQGTGTSNRGFASMDAAKQREIASKGGQSVPAAKRSFSQDRRLAAEAGRKGGQSSHGGGRKQAPETEQAPASANPAPMAADRDEHRDVVHSEPEKVDSH